MLYFKIHLYLFLLPPTVFWWGVEATAYNKPLGNVEMTWTWPPKISNEIKMVDGDPSTGYGILQGYRMEYSGTYPMVNPTVVDIRGDKRSYTVNGLKPMTTYYVRITPVTLRDEISTQHTKFTTADFGM